VALVIQPLSSTAKAVHDARQLALPTVALGVVVAILYFGRVFFITSIAAIVLGVHPGNRLWRCWSASRIPRSPRKLPGVHDRAAVSVCDRA